MILVEHRTFDQANIIVEAREDEPGKPKSLYMKGLFLQGDVKNQNSRVYPANEIRKAVNQLTEKINQGYPILGEIDHPENLQINLDRVSHQIVEVWSEGANGYGKLKILPTPSGQIIRALLESNVKLGVSSRGSGNVETSGTVSEFDIVTVDIVAQPSAPNAYPNAIYENRLQMNGWKNSQTVTSLSTAAVHDPVAQKYLKEEVIKFLSSLK